MAKPPQYVQDAIICGPVPNIRKWQTLPISKLTEGEKVLRFALELLVFPEGVKMGQPLSLDVFQQAFILAAFDGKTHTHKAILSMARRGGKTLVMAVICLYFILSDAAVENTNIRSAAMTREQSGLLFRLMALICAMSPKVTDDIYRAVPSSKRIIGITRNVEYQSLSRDAKSGHGQAIYVLVVDECGQIDAPNDDFLDMLFSSMGTTSVGRVFLISTQAPSDSAFFSVEIDTAQRDSPAGVVVHLYTAATDEIGKRSNWYQANPSIKGGYRSIEDIERNADEAKRIPAKANGFLNLFCNRRVARENAWLAPAVWKENSDAPDWDVFRERGVHIGLDLSQKHDLTVACIAAKDDDGFVHVYPYAFTPETGIDARSARDKVPYREWSDTGILTAVPGEVVDYDWVCQFLRMHLEDDGIDVHSIQFDRWRIAELQGAAERNGFAQVAEWTEVGQGFQSQSVRIEAMETSLLQKKIRHGNHPVLNLGAASAVRVQDPAGNSKLAKNKSSQKIDAIISCLQAIYPLVGLQENSEFEADAMIG